MKTAEEKLKQVREFVDSTRKSIVDPCDEGFTEEEGYDEGYFDESDQAQLQLLDDLEGIL
jgi:hypothetical protein